MERTITVWGKPYAVKIHQSSRAAWSAMGQFQGELLVGRGATAAAALASWATAAKSRPQRRA